MGEIKKMEMVFVELLLTRQLQKKAFLLDLAGEEDEAGAALREAEEHRQRALEIQAELKGED